MCKLNRCLLLTETHIGDTVVFVFFFFLVILSLHINHLNIKLRKYVKCQQLLNVGRGESFSLGLLGKILPISEQTRSLNLKLRHCSLCFTHLCYAVGTDFAQTGAEVQACFDPFLPLTSVTEPHSDNLLLQMKTFGYPGYFLRGRFAFLHEAALQGLLSSQAVVLNKRQGRKSEGIKERISINVWL